METMKLSDCYVIRALTSGFGTSVVVDAWSRGFDYENYIHIHNLCSEKKDVGIPVSKEVYESLCNALKQEHNDYCRTQHHKQWVEEDFMEGV